MAGAVLTYVKDSLDVFGKTRTTVYDAALDASYPADGYSIAAKDVGLRTITDVAIVGSNLATASGGYMAIWDTVNKKLIIFYPTNTTPALGPGIQPVATTSLSGVAFRLRFFGN